MGLSGPMALCESGDPMAEDARRTFASYKREVLHALGNPDESTLDITAGAIVNDALEHIAAMHEWRWLTTGQASLSIVGGQSYVALPADFGTLTALEHDQSWSAFMTPVTWATLIRLRTDPVESWAAGYFYVISTGNVESGEEDAGLSLPTIELYPTPATDADDALMIVYRRFLRRLSHDDDRPQWPAYMDRPLSLLARAFASTDYDDDPASAYSREFSALMGDCITKDGLSARSFGQMGGGAVAGRVRATPFGYPNRGIPDPTSA
jgi:hypothetical protein